MSAQSSSASAHARIITDIDSLSQQGFGQIAAIARLALVAMESPETCRHPEYLAHAFEVIWSIAEDVQNCINAQAEEVGCNYIDPAVSRRQAVGVQGHWTEARHVA